MPHSLFREGISAYTSCLLLYLYTYNDFVLVSNGVSIRSPDYVTPAQRQLC